MIFYIYLYIYIVINISFTQGITKAPMIFWRDGQYTIICENQIIYINNDIFNAFNVYFIIYQLFNIKYPSNIYNTMYFINNLIFIEFKTKKVPRKVLNLIKKIKK